MSTLQKGAAYDNGFAPDNVYGHALELLQRHRVRAEGALHVDVGCGFGRIAEPLVAALGLTYVGCDLDAVGLNSLAGRGFETHRLELADEESIYQALRAIVAGRPVASITIIDTLEHLDDPAATMRALRRIAAEHCAFVLISVPNTTHRDLGFRLLFGQWDYTETGILDHTHRVLFSDTVLRQMLAHSGLHVVAANDVEMTISDQAFPADHPAFQAGTNLHALLGALRNQGDAFGRTNQLVRLCTPGPVEAVQPYVERVDEPRLFLSIVMRTQGKRSDTLAEVMTCLAGQSVADFEVLIVGHKLDVPHQIAVERIIEDLPVWLRDKTRLVRVDLGNRTRLLNVGFAAARGRYIVILDDDDTVFGHWVETFAALSTTAPGQILRTVSAVQTIRRVEYNYAVSLRAESGLETPYPSQFDWFEHLRVNYSPGMTLAFPRGLFHHLNLSFDESLTTTEDWDYLLQTAGLVGVASAPDITAIYRRWVGAESSATVHSVEEWEHNFTSVQAKIDNSALILWPVGTTRRLRIMLDNIGVPERRVAEFEARMEALRQVNNIYLSSTWRLTAPVRLIGRLLGRQPPNPAVAWSLSTQELHDLASALRSSTSWRLGAAMRRIARPR